MTAPSCRYKVLAQQYRDMYPTLEIDVDGELVRLKVTQFNWDLLLVHPTPRPPPCSLMLSL